MLTYLVIAAILAVILLFVLLFYYLYVIGATLTILMILTATVTVVFFAILAYYLYVIGGILDAIGGSGDSYLAKLRLGLRAIETETGHLPVQVTKLNQNLTAIGQGLEAVDGNLTQTIDAVVRQEGGGL